MSEPNNCNHEFRKVDPVHNKVVSMTFEPEICPHCLRNRIAELQDILSGIMAFGVTEPDDEEDEKFHADLLDRIDKVMDQAKRYPPTSEVKNPMRLLLDID